MTIVLRYALAAIFAISAAAKLVDFSATLKILTNIGIKGPIGFILLFLLILLEFMLAVLLMLPLRSRLNLYAAITVMIVGFTIFGTFLMIEQEDNCGCFGAILSFTPLETLIKNFIFLVMVEILKGFEKNRHEN